MSRLPTRKQRLGGIRIDFSLSTRVLLGVVESRSLENLIALISTFGFRFCCVNRFLNASSFFPFCVTSVDVLSIDIGIKKMKNEAQVLELDSFYFLRTIVVVVQLSKQWSLQLIIRVAHLRLYKVSPPHLAGDLRRLSEISTVTWSLSIVRNLHHSRRIFSFA